MSKDLYGRSEKIKNELVNVDKLPEEIEDSLIAGIITPDKDIIPNSENLSPAYIVFNNYELILKWNRSLRFGISVCTLANKIKS